MRCLTCYFLLLLPPVALSGQTTTSPITVPRAAGRIIVDGTIEDAEWQGARRFDTWYEINPGDNVEPKVKSVGWVTYDERFFYVGLDLHDPSPANIRAPFADRDGISGSSDDFAGIILDTRNDARIGLELYVTPRGTQFDSIIDDVAGGEDASPDFYWDAAARITDHGWSAELRIPFSSLRYPKADVQTWGMILYRNWPRERRYQIFTSKLPRGANCTVCNFVKITMEGLPGGGRIIAAPYLAGHQLSDAESNPGSPFVRHPIAADAGADFKWTPNAGTAIDATINPDFSQVESDVGVISTNERFAIFYPEKRPFFLEGIELFKTPVQAVYTRNITSPRWGFRGTGKHGRNAYTILVADDRGGGSVILPSPLGSSFADQDFESTAMIGRIRRDYGRSFVSLLATARESEGGAHNRVFGPDFQWRRGERHTLTGQWLWSDTMTPTIPLLAEEWNGQKLSSHAGQLTYSYLDPKHDLSIDYRDFGRDFRADNGFVPQTGFRGSHAEGGYTIRPVGFFSRARGFALGQYQAADGGSLLYRLASVGVAADGKYRSSSRLRLARDTVRTNAGTFDRERVYFQMQFAVNRVLSLVGVEGWIGDEVDFVRNRPGEGANIALNATLRPDDRLQLNGYANVRWLDLDDDRLFTSQIERLRAQYTFNSKMYARVVIQNSRTHRDKRLYEEGAPEIRVDRHEGDLGAQMLFAYEVNWQTVLFIGVSDLREVSAAEADLEPASRQLFFKVGYAFQR